MSLPLALSGPAACPECVAQPGARTVSPGLLGQRTAAPPQDGTLSNVPLRTDTVKLRLPFWSWLKKRVKCVDRLPSM
jgi:hypothetical protein